MLQLLRIASSSKDSGKQGGHRDPHCKGYVDPPNILGITGPTPTALLVHFPTAAANCWFPSGIKFSEIGREQAGLEPSKAPTGSLLSLLKTLYFFDVKIMSLPPGLNTKTNLAVPSAGPKPQACGWGAKEAAGGAAQSLAPPDSCWAPLRRQGGCVLQRPSLPFFTIKQDSTSRATSLPCPRGGSQEVEAYASS